MYIYIYYIYTHIQIHISVLYVCLCCLFCLFYVCCLFRFFFASYSRSTYQHPARLWISLKSDIILKGVNFPQKTGNAPGISARRILLCALLENGRTATPASSRASCPATKGLGQGNLLCWREGRTVET